MRQICGYNKTKYKKTRPPHPTTDYCNSFLALGRWKCAPIRFSLNEYVGGLTLLFDTRCLAFSSCLRLILHTWLGVRSRKGIHLIHAFWAKPFSFWNSLQWRVKATQVIRVVALSDR